MVWEGTNAVSQGRWMMGETDPQKSLPGSIRGDFSINLGRNIIHGSDSNDSAKHEIGMWFTDAESNFSSDIFAGHFFLPLPPPLCTT